MTQKTFLYDWHVAHQASMTTFSNTLMPMHYGSQIQEHLTVRRDAGMFDVSHMQVIDITGPQAKSYLLKVFANNVDKLKQPGRGIYGCLLNEQGGIIDDLIVYFLQDNFYRLVVNAGRKTVDIDWLKRIQAQDNFDIKIAPRDDLSIIAIQGPCAREKMAAFFPEIIQAQIMTFNKFGCLLSDQTMIARTGYTGEDGLEIILPHKQALILWEWAYEKNIMPIGLGARDTLRLEAGLNLYGQDMTEHTIPLESRLTWTIGFQPTTRMFIGRQALEGKKQTGSATQLIGCMLEGKGILRAGQKVLHEQTVVGEITSGSFSPSLKGSIAFARVQIDQIAPQEKYTVMIRKKAHSVLVVPVPFFKSELKQKSTVSSEN